MGHTHGIVFAVGGKFDVDSVVGEVVGKVHVGEDPVGEVVVGQVAGEGIGEVHVEEVVEPVVGEVDGTVHVGKYETGEVVACQVVGEVVGEVHVVEDGIEEEVAVGELAVGEVEFGQVVEEMYRRGLPKDPYGEVPQSTHFRRPLLHCLFFSDLLWCP